MSELYFSFDPADSIAFHGTADGTKKVCIRALQDEREMALEAGEWSDETIGILRGVVLGRVCAAGENDYALVDTDYQEEITALRAEVLDLRKKLREQQAATKKWMEIARKGESFDE